MRWLFMKVMLKLKALKKNFASYVSMRIRRLNNFIANAIDRRYFYSAGKFIEELTELGAAERAEYWSGQLAGARSRRTDLAGTETKQSALIFMAERGSARAARELMAMQERPDDKVIDKLIMFKMQEIRNNPNKYIIAEDIAVVSAFLESGYLPDQTLAEELRENPSLANLVIKVRKQN